jgi:sulfate adenylyltransferase
MYKLKINYQTLTDIINIKYNIFYPLKKFLSKKDFNLVVEKNELSNGKFFPFPIFFSVNKTDYQRISNKKNIQIIYDQTVVCTLRINSFYKVNKKNIGRKIFNTSNHDHPGFKYFIETGNYNIDCEIEKFNKEILKKISFSNPINIKNMIKKRKLKTIVGFHTRNAPHRAHEWIHSFGLKNCEGLLIQPMIGQFKKNEYKSDFIINSNKKLVEKIYNKKNILFGVFNSYPRYGGPREAVFHALVRKNYGCTHFLVGRDHAGYKNFYKKYESQNFCKKYEKKIKIKILKFNEPFLCKKNNKVLNNIKHCKGKGLPISGTYIRNLLLKKKEIPSSIMRKEISILLKKDSIIKKTNKNFPL